VEDFAIADDVPLCEDWEPTFRESGCLDVEFFGRLEIIGECSEELVRHKTTFVVGKAVFTGFVDLEGVLSPDDELSFFVHFPIQGPEAMCFAELADCLCIRYDRTGRCRGCLERCHC